MGLKIRASIPVAVGVLLAAGFVRLGLWQLDRAEQKAEWLAEFDRHTAQGPVALSRWQSQPRYTPVELTGEFIDRPPIFHDNRIREGRPGVDIYAPFAPSGGGPAVLVNLGWRPVDQRLGLPDAPVPQRTAMSGLLAPPPAVGVRLGSALTPQDQPPHRVPYLDLTEVAAVLNLELAPQILLATAPNETYLRDWTPASLPPERHRGYAVQWFALAAAVAALTGWGITRLWASPHFSQGGPDSD